LDEKIENYKVSFFGLGFVGLCMAACFSADKNIYTTGIDIDENKIKLINNGESPFYEPKLLGLLKKSIFKKTLICDQDYIKAIKNTNMSFITVGTPSDENGRINLDFIKSVSKNMGFALREKKDYHVIVIKSTVIPGTTLDIINPIIESVSGKKVGISYGLIYNPEFLREGNTIDDIRNPDKIIIGEYDKISGDIIESFYKRYYDQKPIPTIRTNIPNAEMIKYANNAFLATKISYINSIANLCEKIPGLDVKIVSKAIGLDRRIGPHFLNAGIGFGGSCFPKDVKALINFSIDSNCHLKLLEEVININDHQYKIVIEELKKELISLNNKKISILGLSFKPNTDDIRESRSILLIKDLIEENCIVDVYDPMAINNIKEIFLDKIKYSLSYFECIKDSDGCIIATDWDEFKNIKEEHYQKLMKFPFVIDGRLLYDPNKYNNIKFKAIGMGPLLMTDNL